MVYEPLHHKYRPQTFTQLVGQDAIATTLSNALAQQRIAPAYLFCGPRGTGKTSSARILAKSLNCLSHPTPHVSPCGRCEVCQGINNGSILDIVEIDAASNTGVDNIRELIERAQFAPVQCRHKVYVIDECHMLSTAAFNALLKTLEEPPPHVVFVLATTDPQRVLPTIISRCQRFDFRRIPLEAMVGHLQAIAQQEMIQITEAALRLVAQVAQGGLRDAESLLDQLSLLEPPVTAEMVWNLVGAVPERELLTLVQAIAADDSVAVLDTVRRLLDRGREPMIVLQNLAGFYRDLIIAKTASGREDLVAVTSPTWEAMQALVQSLPIPSLLLGQQTLRQAETQLRNTTQPRLWLEATLMGLLPSALSAGGGISQPSAPRPAPRVAATVRPTTSPPVPANVVSPPAPVVAPATASPVVPNSSTKVQPPPAAEDNSVLSSPPSPATQTPIVSPGAILPTDRVIPQSGTSVADLPQLWSRIIRSLEPLGTRALMQQQGHLIDYDGQTARIGIKSKPLFKMAKGRVPHVEAAFQTLLNQSVKVTLEVVEVSPNNVASPQLDSSSAASTSQDTAPSSATSGKTAIPPPLEGPKRSTPPAPAPLPPQSQIPPPTAPPAWTPTSDLDRAVKNFAEFFNGQIVPPDEEEAAQENGKTTQGKEIPLKQPPSPGHPPYLGNNDVPF